MKKSLNIENVFSNLATSLFSLLLVFTLLLLSTNIFAQNGADSLSGTIPDPGPDPDSYGFFEESIIVNPVPSSDAVISTQTNGTATTRIVSEQKNTLGTGNPGGNPDATTNPIFTGRISTPRTGAMSQILLATRLDGGNVIKVLSKDPEPNQRIITGVVAADPGGNPDATSNPIFTGRVSTPRTGAMSQVLLATRLGGGDIVKVLSKNLAANQNGEANMVSADPGENPDAAPNPVFTTRISTPRTGAMSQVLLEWRLNTQKTIAKYQIEKSVAGRPFTVVNSVSVDLNNDNMYSLPVMQAESEVTYYRIASVSLSGKTQYSKVFEVKPSLMQIAIAPTANPLLNGDVKIKLKNAGKGLYNFNVINMAGYKAFTKQVNVLADNFTNDLLIGRVGVRGNYLIEITRPDGNKSCLKVMY